MTSVVPSLKVLQDIPRLRFFKLRRVGVSTCQSETRGGRAGSLDTIDCRDIPSRQKTNPRARVPARARSSQLASFDPIDPDQPVGRATRDQATRRQLRVPRDARDGHARVPRADQVHSLALLVGVFSLGQRVYARVALFATSHERAKKRISVWFSEETRKCFRRRRDPFRIQRTWI